MKLLVIGLGSMGKRRINLLTKYFPGEADIVGIDTKEDRRSEAEKLYGLRTYSSVEDAVELEHPDAALICTSPIYHSSIILKCLDYKLHIFTELNLLSEGYDEIINKAKNCSLQLFLSSTFLYRKEIQYIQEQVQKSESRLHYRYHVGQYLPDWHPWEGYKEFFVGDKRTNGCRELFAIELPWIIKTFGKVIDYKVINDKISSLDLDYPDSYMVMLEHESGNKGVISVDVVSRKPVRSLEVYSEELHLFWEGTPHGLSQYDIKTKQINKIETYSTIDKDTRYSENIIENAYLEELQVFIKKLKGEEAKQRYTFEEDLYTLELIDKIEGA